MVKTPLTSTMTAHNLLATVSLPWKITRPDRSLYASKPGKASPEGRYIWRMVVFLVSPRPAHQCTPVTAHFELGTYHKIKPLLDRLDRIVDQIVDAIPVEQWHGVRRYASIIG